MKCNRGSQVTRRGLILGGSAIAVGAVLLRGRELLGADTMPASQEAEGEISPVEDLMREHGVYLRLGLIFEEIRTRLLAAQEFPRSALTSAVDISHRFIHEYHERLEEQEIFPVFEKAQQHVELVKVLREQHEQGRKLNAQIRQWSMPRLLKDIGMRRKLTQDLYSVNQMYTPHLAREDTVLFPAFASLVGHDRCEELGEQFEKKEHQLFGEAGFEGIVNQVAEIEKSLEMYDLARFTGHPLM